MQSMALVATFTRTHENQILSHFLSVVFGTVLLIALSQVVIPLPWTPVPITGQTLGVSLVALLWGWKRGATCVGLYLGLGFIGAPVFAGGASGLLLGPTFGYLVGMACASVAMGHLADLGLARKFSTALFSCYVGSFITLSFGVIGLSFFVQSPELLWAGVIPFLPGDLIKNTISAGIVSSANKWSESLQK